MLYPAVPHIIVHHRSCFDHANDARSVIIAPMLRSKCTPFREKR